jgi:uncharacterized protein (DUF2267 family)
MNAREFIGQVHAACGGDEADAWRATRSVLAALSDRLTPDEACNLAAQLAEPLKGIVYKTPRDGVQKMDREIFVARVSRDLGVDIAEAVKRIRAVYAVLEQAVSSGGTRHAMAQLPEQLREVMKPPA